MSNRSSEDPLREIEVRMDGHVLSIGYVGACVFDLDDNPVNISHDDVKGAISYYSELFDVRQGQKL